VKKIIPEGRVRRMVAIDHAALTWALAVVKDEKHNVITRGAMSDEWLKKYQGAEAHLMELIAASERT
jgi:hypothetical protein